MSLLSRLWLFVWIVLAPPAGLRAQSVTIPQSTAQRHGLTRAWQSCSVPLQRTVTCPAAEAEDAAPVIVATTADFVRTVSDSISSITESASRALIAQRAVADTITSITATHRLRSAPVLLHYFVFLEPIHL